MSPDRTGSLSQTISINLYSLSNKIKSSIVSPEKALIDNWSIALDLLRVYHDRPILSTGQINRHVILSDIPPDSYTGLSFFRCPLFPVIFQFSVAADRDLAVFLEDGLRISAYTAVENDFLHVEEFFCIGAG